MRHNHFLHRLICNQQGGSLILVGLMLPLLMVVMAIAVDMGRLYAVQAKAQNAVDAALLGAVATINSNMEPLPVEVTTLFNANYPTSYMGSSIGPINAYEVGATGIYEANFIVTVPSSVTGILGSGTTAINIFSQVTKGYETAPLRRLELAMVLDNTGSLGSNMASLKQASHDLVSILYGPATTLNNLHISVVPYDIVVNIGPTREGWIQDPSYPKYIRMANGQTPYNTPMGFAFNRNTDVLCGPYQGPLVWFDEVCWPGGNGQSCNPELGGCVPVSWPPGCRPAGYYPEWWTTSCTNNGLNDVDDTPPTTEQTKFRLPYENWVQDHPDWWNNPEKQNHLYVTSLAPLVFNKNVRAEVDAAIDAMQISGATRIPVGLMWGWFTLSPRWQGVWDSAQPNAPESPHQDLTKALILMTDGLNVWPSIDDPKTLALCEAIKDQGVTIYTVGYGTGSQINEQLLEDCATQPSYFFLAPTETDLRRAFRQIADDMVANSTLRLSR